MSRAPTYALGIDLGTTYTAAATLREGRPQVVPLGTRIPEIPSVVFLAPDGDMLVGEAAERRGVTEPGRLAREFKRRLGDPAPILLAGAPYSAQALTARILRFVVDAVVTREGEPPHDIVLTRPANWGPFKRDLLDQAIRLADLTDIRTATEPEAAAVNYATTTRVAPGEVLAVYDLGGGTFDAAVLRKTDDGFELIGEPEGIEHLGGIDFDEAVFSHVLAGLRDRVGGLDRSDPAVVAAVARLRRDCVEAKEALSADTEVAIPVTIPDAHTEVRLTRGEFEAMVRPALGDTIGALRRAIRSAGLEDRDVKVVVLVGGSSRIPLVAQLVNTELGLPIALDAHPKHSIALGAAILAHGAPLEVDPAAGGRGPARTGSVGVVARAPATEPPTGAEQSGGGTDTAEPLADLPVAPSRSRVNRGVLAGVVAGVVAIVVIVVVALSTGGGDGGEAASPSGSVVSTEAAASTVTTAETPASSSTSSAAPSTAATTAPPPATSILVPAADAPASASEIAYTSVSGDNWDVYVIDAADPSRRRRLTTNPARDLLPAWSPDRRSVAYTQEAGQWEIRAVAAGGGVDVPLPGDLKSDARVAWSPDGRRLAYVSEQDGVPDVYLLDVTSGSIERLTNDPVQEGDPAWSPDGTRIAMWRSEGTGTNLWVVDVAATLARRAAGGTDIDGYRLPIQAEQNADPAWSPDGTLIAFSAVPSGGNWDLFIMNADGTGSPVQLTDDPADDQGPSWAPDGNAIAFESKREAGDAEVYVMAADGSDQRALTDNAGFDGHAAWGTFPPA